MGPPGHNFITDGASGPGSYQFFLWETDLRRRRTGTARERMGFAWHPEQSACPSLWYTVYFSCLFYHLAGSSLKAGLVFFFPVHEIFPKFSAR